MISVKRFFFVKYKCLLSLCKLYRIYKLEFPSQTAQCIFYLILTHPSSMPFLSHYDKQNEIMSLYRLSKAKEMRSAGKVGPYCWLLHTYHHYGRSQRGHWSLKPNSASSLLQSPAAITAEHSGPL